MILRLARSSSILILALLVASTGSQGQEAPKGKKHPGRLGPALSQLADAHEDDGDGKAERRADELGVRLHRRGAGAEVTALLEPADGKGIASIDRDALAKLGASIVAESESFLRVHVPIRSLRRLGGHADLRIARAPTASRALDGLGANLSESVALTGASTLQQGGLTGAGVKIAVVDLGFTGLSSAISAGELPANTVKVLLGGQGSDLGFLESNTPHGVGVSEHVADMAPGAQIHCIRVEDDLDLQNAAAYCLSNGIRIANHSVGWVNASYYDGSGPISSIINNSNAQGVLWCVAAGNDADRHWRGVWADSNADNTLDFANSPESFLSLSGSAGGAQLFLNWNQYGNAVTDLDLYVYDKSNAYVTSSAAFQSSTHLPTEAVAFNYIATKGPYHVRVRKYGGGPTAGLDVSLFCFTHALSPGVPGSSLMDPACAPGAFTVGAINQTVFAQSNPPLEYYSSQGPTTDGRLKPDVAAPDGTTSRTYGLHASFGTSFASPTTAGAAALILSQNPSLTTAQLAAALRKLAIDTGAPGPDNQYGSGKLALTTNAPPVAASQAVSTPVGTPVAVTLGGSDPNGDPLTYEVIAGAGPFAGTLSGTAPNLTYTPNPGVSGTDSFHFRVDDGIWDSAAATVSITIAAGNRGPVANAQTVGTTPNSPVAIVLTGSDPDGDPITYALAAAPSHGALSGVAPNLTYTPAPGYQGPDLFTFTVNDGSVDSLPAAVSISVVAVNTPPVAATQSVATVEDTVLPIALSGSDADGNPLTFTVLTPPTKGVLSGAAPNLTYTPNLNANGADSFTFKASDGLADSPAATVSIAITPVNDAPVAAPQAKSTVQSTAVAVTLAAGDVDGDALTYAVVTGPSHGTLTGAAPSLTYFPAAGYTGPDSFTFKANDGTVDSVPATVSITVTPAAPVVYATETFETGNFSGGTGWAAAWTTSGDLVNTTSGTPHAGTRHARLRRSTGYMKRTLTLSGQATVRLKFWSKLGSFESSDKAEVKISTDGGVTWITVKTFTSADAQNVYASFDLPISVAGAATLQVAFDAGMSGTGDNWYVDDVQITN